MRIEFLIPILVRSEFTKSSGLWKTLIFVYPSIGQFVIRWTDGPKRSVGSLGFSENRFNEPSSTSHPVSQRLIGVVTFSDLIYTRETLSLDAGFPLLLLLFLPVFHALDEIDIIHSRREKSELRIDRDRFLVSR